MLLWGKFISSTYLNCPGLIPGGGTNFHKLHSAIKKKKRLNIHNKRYPFKEYLHIVFYLKII